jgi:hypothetical protein
MGYIVSELCMTKRRKMRIDAETGLILDAKTKNKQGKYKHENQKTSKRQTRHKPTHNAGFTPRGRHRRGLILRLFDLTLRNV